MTDDDTATTDEPTRTTTAPGVRVPDTAVLIADMLRRKHFDRPGTVALVGCLLVVLGAGMTWPDRSPLLYGPEYGIPDAEALASGGIPWGYQLLDLPMVLIALIGGVVVSRDRRHRLAGAASLVAALGVVVLAIRQAASVGAGPFSLTFGYYVTLGGAALLAVAGSLRSWRWVRG